MKHLWSPWRLEYLTAPKADGCVFCHAARSEEDRENLVLLRGERAFLILNRYPYNNGHFMVVPYAHVPSLEDLDAQTLTEMMLLLNRGLAALRATMHPQGFNIGANLGQRCGRGHRGARPHPRRAPLVRRHQLYAGRRRHARRSPDLDADLRQLEGCAGRTRRT